MTDPQLTAFAKTISARSPFDLRNKLAAKFGFSFSTAPQVWEQLSRIAQAVWDARQAK